MAKNKNISKNKRAYCGDGLLRYCIGKIFSINAANTSYMGHLESNKVLSEIVHKHPDIFGKPQDTHANGTTFEAHLFDIFEEQGAETALEFVRKIFEIVYVNELPHPYETYAQWIQRKNQRLHSYVSTTEKFVPNYMFP